MTRKIAKASDEAKLLSVEQIAVRLQCSPMHVYNNLDAWFPDRVDLASPGAKKAKTRVHVDHVDAFERGRLTAKRRPAA